MKHTTALAAALLASLPLAHAQATSIFINELHYDNAGSDIDEGIEIAGIAGTDLAGWTLLYYNGGDGSIYDSLALGGTIADQSNGYGTLYFAAAGTQNGPDGIALVDPSALVVQFLSYEGTFMAIEGAAAGLMSTDIGVFEDGRRQPACRCSSPAAAATTRTLHGARRCRRPTAP